MRFKNWPQLSVPSGDWLRLNIIQGLLKQRPDLVDWLFKEDRPQLFASSEEVLSQAKVYSSGEQILIQLSVDVWCGKGHTLVFDVCRRLDDENFREVLAAMILMRKM